MNENENKEKKKRGLSKALIALENQTLRSA